MLLILEYFSFQFIETPKKIFNIFKNLIWFGVNFLSIKYCFQTLFQPWRRIVWDYKRGFDLGNRIDILVSNTFSRFLGLIMRLSIIIAFVIYEVFIILLGAFLILFRILIPFLAILGIFISFSLI